jgi:glycosyltransferase involved in cell wall biosynthesis
VKLVTVNNARNVSGCEENQLDLARWFRSERGCETVFFVRDESALGDRAEALGFAVQRVFRGGMGRLTSLFSLARALYKERPDVVSINREHNIYPVYAALKVVQPFMKNTPLLVAVFHSPTGRRYPLLKRFDGVICTSEYTGESFFANNAGLRERTRIIPYGTFLPPLEPSDKENDLRPRRLFEQRSFPLVGMVGDLWKNQAELVDIANLVRDEFPGITIAVVGAGSPEAVEALRRKIEENGLQDNFILSGRIDRSRIPDLFFDFDVSLSTYRHEGFGIVHIESLAAMTPLIAYNSGGIREIVRNGGGILVEGGTPEFAAALAGLLRDGDRRRALGREGRRVVEEFFTMDIMCGRHFEYYSALLDAAHTESEAHA